MKSVPNCISVSRIIFSLILFFITPLSIAFYVIYIICGLSDIIDGFIARKFGATSRLGEKLDSIADMLMMGVLLVVLYPIIHPVIEIFIWIIVIFVIRVVSMILAFKKYHTFAMLHTYGNKITGLVLFLIPILLPFIHSTVLMYLICAVASISAIEELIIQFTSKELQVNKPSIFIK